jgi:hypothetical protein
VRHKAKQAKYNVGELKPIGFDQSSRIQRIPVTIQDKLSGQTIVFKDKEYPVLREGWRTKEMKQVEKEHQEYLKERDAMIRESQERRPEAMKKTLQKRFDMLNWYSPEQVRSDEAIKALKPVVPENVIRNNALMLKQMLVKEVKDMPMLTKEGRAMKQYQIDQIDKFINDPSRAEDYKKPVTEVVAKAMGVGVVKQERPEGVKEVLKIRKEGEPYRSPGDAETFEQFMYRKFNEAKEDKRGGIAKLTKLVAPVTYVGYKEGGKILDSSFKSVEQNIKQQGS